VCDHRIPSNPKVPVRTTVTGFKLDEANAALAAVREGRPS